MIDTNKLKGQIVSKGLTQEEVAQRIGITPTSFYGKMKKGVFKSDEIEKMISILEIESPIEIFFPNK